MEHCRAIRRPNYLFLHAALAFVLLCLMVGSARADQWSLLVNGKAIHFDVPNGTKFNERNWGAGLQYDFDVTEDDWVPFLTASGFKDSNGNPSYYAGGGAMHRFRIADNVHLDAGAVAFVMTRKNFHDGDPFLGALPALSFGTPRVSVNMTYVPKIDPKALPLVFFQLKIGLQSAP